MLFVGQQLQMKGDYRFRCRKEGHGIGLQNVKLVVEKYHGQMEICHTEKSFQVKILLYMKLDEK